MLKENASVSWRAKMYFCFFCFLCGALGTFFAYEDFINESIRAIIEPRFNFMAMRTHDAIHDGWEKNVTAENYVEASKWLQEQKENRFMATRFSVTVYKDGRFYAKMTSEDPEKVPFMSDVSFFFEDFEDKLKTFLKDAEPGGTLRLYDGAHKSILSCVLSDEPVQEGERQIFCAEGAVYSQSTVLRAVGDLFEKFTLLMILAFAPFFLFMREILSARVNTLEKIVEARTKDLRDALDQAEESMRMKAQFMANVNHELRTPLNAIAGFSEMMQREMFGPIDNEKYREYVKSIHSSAVMLTDMINQMLDAAKYESGRVILHYSKVNADEILNGVRSVIEGYPDADKRVISIKNTVKKPLFTDRNVLVHILLNLLSNAVKYTHEGGRVAVTVDKTDEGGMVIRCTDDGIGIPKELQESIFMPFVQVENAVTKAHKGTGLGLYLMQKMAAVLGAAVSVESDGVKGSVFSVVFSASVFEKKEKELQKS